MGRALALIKGLGLGAGLMYIFDPDLGRRRRALMRDQVEHTVNELGDFLGKASRDLYNRACGVAAELGTMFDAEVPDDRRLVERVRAKLGRVVSHPKAIVVTADRGRVTLRGPILAHEAEPLCRAVAEVRGVLAVEDQLEIHDQPGGIGALQGGAPRPGERGELWQGHWSPAMQLIVGAAGGVLALKIARRGGLTALAVAAAGLGLAARGTHDSSRHLRRPRRSGREQSLTSARL
jgi:hypothetical protein